MMNGTTATQSLTVAVLGLGQMGLSHAKAYHSLPGYQIVGLADRSKKELPPDLQPYPVYTSLDELLAIMPRPDVISINSHTDTHARYAIQALEAGCHVFVEKPLAAIAQEAQRVVDTARRTNRKLVIGYILRMHPSWQEFIRQARQLGPPYVMRMNLNQRSTGPAWDIHRHILEHASPVIDCGVHYLDVMLQIADAKPTQVRGMGVRLSGEIDKGQVNYGHLQIIFEDGSVGWYEAGWGPMISETAYLVKDVIGPKGSISIAAEEKEGTSADVDNHTKVSKFKLHRVGEKVSVLNMNGEPGHDELCQLEQEFLWNAVRQDQDLSEHWENVVRSLIVVLAADQSMKEGRAIDL